MYTYICISVVGFPIPHVGFPQLSLSSGGISLAFFLVMIFFLVVVCFFQSPPHDRTTGGNKLLLHECLREDIPQLIVG